MDAHQIAIDGSSYAMLMPELITLYNGGQLSGLPTSYSAYDLWELERFGASVAELYLKFTLGGSIGLKTLKTSTFMDAESRRYAIVPGGGPLAHLPFGFHRQQHQGAGDPPEVAAAAYEATVLNAVKG